MNLTTNFAAIRQRFPDPDPALESNGQSCRPGSACTLYLDGQRVGLIGLDDGGIRDVTAFMSPGSHEVTLRVCGGYKNMLGPHHDPARERRSAWPGMWKKAPKFGRPAAEQYDLMAYGANSAMRFYGDE